MTLTPPKRLFDVSLMKTVMYEDVIDDVKRGGYACVSHVWGDQQLYPATELGIKGVDWEIPLSNPSKISRLVDAMKEYEMKYCWFDILCMPQDKQGEINEEIPLMGDYYSGAKITFVLSDKRYEISEEFGRWYDTALNATDEFILEQTSILSATGQIAQLKKRFMRVLDDPTITSISGNMDDLPRSHDLLYIEMEPWFQRVWTLQETILSETLIIVDKEGYYLDLTQIFNRIEHLSNLHTEYLYVIFGESIQMLMPLISLIHRHKDKTLDLASVLSHSAKRECNKIHDKIYGALGLLGYKGFVVDYNISIEHLNMMIIKHAYFKGDISWISVESGAKDVIQPMYRTFLNVGCSWKSFAPISQQVVLDNNTVSINVGHIGTVVKCKKFEITRENSISWFISTFGKWGFPPSSILSVLTGFRQTLHDEVAKLCLVLMSSDNGMYLIDKYKGLIPENTLKLILESYNLMYDFIGEHVYAAEIWMEYDGKPCPLIIHGNVKNGDMIMLTKMYDSHNRNLGIVASKSFKRRGLCICPPVPTKLPFGFVLFTHNPRTINTKIVDDLSTFGYRFVDHLAPWIHKRQSTCYSRYNNIGHNINKPVQQIISSSYIL